MTKKYMLALDPALVSKTGDKDCQHAVSAIRDVESAFRAAGYEPERAPDLDGRGSSDAYMWKHISRPRLDALWFESHGSSKRGVSQIKLEEIARMHRSGDDDWGRMLSRLWVFGSCYTGRSPLFSDDCPLLGYLVAGTTVAVVSDDLVKFKDGPKYYRGLVEAWIGTSEQEPESRAGALNRVSSVFRAQVVQPA